jgi:hypothetical protein
VESAIRYSKEAPLDVDLALPQEVEFIEKIVSNLLVPTEQSYRFNDERYERLLVWIEEAFNANPDGLPLCEDATEALSRFMTTFVGSQGKNLLRLRRFELDYNPGDFDPSKWATALSHPTPCLEELALQARGLEYSSLATLLFTPPMPKLSSISVQAGYPIEQLLHHDHSIEYLRLDFTGLTDLKTFPDRQFLGHIKHLCLKIYPFVPDAEARTEDLLLPSLETFTIWGRIYGSACIKAPRLKILRLFDSGVVRIVSPSGPIFPVSDKGAL